MKVDCGVIGGTGVGERLTQLGGTQVHVPTSFGMLRGRLLEHNGRGLFLIQRHSLGHKTPPHLVNYRAMAEGLSRLGARACFSSAAVGSLRDNILPGSFRVCSDFLDASGRNITLFNRSVRHTDCSRFSDNPAYAALAQSAGTADATVYINSNGPRYETPSEVRLYAEWGADIVGMTASSEAFAMSEAQIDYACLAIVTNLAAGLSKVALSHGEVADAMKAKGGRAVDILLAAASK